MKYSVDAIADAIASAPRRAVLDRLARGPASISDVAAASGTSLASLDRHVRILESAGLVRKHKRGRVATVSLVPGGLGPLLDWASGVQSDWPGALERLAAHTTEQS